MLATSECGQKLYLPPIKPHLPTIELPVTPPALKAIMNHPSANPPKPQTQYRAYLKKNRPMPDPMTAAMMHARQ
jgi:hypothetical protein